MRAIELSQPSRHSLGQRRVVLAFVNRRELYRRPIERIEPKEGGHPCQSLGQALTKLTTLEHEQLLSLETRQVSLELRGVKAPSNETRLELVRPRLDARKLSVDYLLEAGERV